MMLSSGETKIFGNIEQSSKESGKIQNE